MGSELIQRRSAVELLRTQICFLLNRSSILSDIPLDKIRVYTEKVCAVIKDIPGSIEEDRKRISFSGRV